MEPKIAAMVLLVCAIEMMAFYAALKSSRAPDFDDDDGPRPGLPPDLKRMS